MPPADESAVDSSCGGTGGPSDRGVGTPCPPGGSTAPGRATSLLRDTTVTFASRALAIMLSLGIASATAWLLGPAGKGELSICLVFASLLVLGLGFGVEMGCAYHVGSKRAPVEAILGVQIVGFGVTVALMVVVGVGCLYSPLPFVGKVPFTALVLAIVYAGTQLFFVYMTVLFMGLGRLTHYNLARIGSQGVTFLFLLGGCWLYPNSAVAVAAYGVGALAAGSSLVAALARGRMATGITISWATIAACYKYGIKYYFGKLATLTNVQLGVIVISLIGTVENVGLFSAAIGLVSRLSIVPETLNIVLLPRVLRRQAAAADLVVRCCRVAMIVTAAMAILLAVLSKPVVALLLSPAFLPAVGPLLLLLPSALMRCFSHVLISYFNGVGRPEYNSVTLLTGLAVNVVLMLLLLPRWGLLGAATATTLAYFTQAWLAILLFRRSTRTAWREFLPRAGDIKTILSLARQRGGSQPRDDGSGEVSE